mgnify:CR=1 FL=1
MGFRFVLLLGLALAGLVAAVDQEVSEKAPPKAGKKKQKKKKKDPDKWRLRLGTEPSLRYGKAFEAQFRYRIQTDAVAVDPDPEAERDAFHLRRHRVGIQGTFLRDFEYEVEYDFAQAERATRDAYINYRGARWLQVQGGRFKLPFGRDQLQSPSALNFVYRSRLGADIAPGRQTGVMLHGPVFGRRLRYEAGYFLHDGENSYGIGGERGGDRMGAVRLRSEPARWGKLPARFQDLELGFAATRGNVREGRHGLDGRTSFGSTYFPRVEAKGPRLRLGVDVNWTPGPFFVQAEFIHMRQQRHGQGVYLNDLPDLVARGWYASAGWVVTGEKKAGGVRPKRPLFQGGFGAVEVAFRQEGLRFGSAGRPGEPTLSPRSEGLFSSSDRATTLGANWYVNRLVKVQANMIREAVDSPYLDWSRPRRTFWTRVVRLQFSL